MPKLKENIFLILEISLAYMFVFISLPLLIISVFLVLLDQTGSIIFLQDRYGKDKKIYKIYKFRTMHKLAEMDRPIWGKEFDSRSSKIGNFLRVTHLDEFPQLFNVIKGEMSLVGPRPERPFFAEKFKSVIPDYERRHMVKPGITGWAQVNGLRGESCVKERSLYDNFYVSNCSLILYFKILILTLFAKPIKHGHAMHHPEHRNILFLAKIPSLLFS